MRNPSERLWLVTVFVQRGSQQEIATVSHHLAEKYTSLAIGRDEMRNQQFGVGFDRGPRPCISRAIKRIFHRSNILLLSSGERPNFIDLNALRLSEAFLSLVVRKALPWLFWRKLLEEFRPTLWLPNSLAIFLVYKSPLPISG